MAGENDNDPFEGLVDTTQDANDALDNTEVAPADTEDDQVGRISDAEESQDDDQETDQDADADVDADSDDEHSTSDGDADDAGDDEGGAEDDSTSGETERDGENESSDDEKPRKKKRSPQDRINKAVKEQRRAERKTQAAEARTVALEQRLENLEKGLTAGNADGKAGDTEVSTTLVKPDVTDTEKYPYGELDTQYLEDLTEYRVDLKLEKRDAKHAAKEQEAIATKDAQEWSTKYDAKIVDGLAAYDDFDEMVVKGSENEEFDLTPETAMMALDSKVGHHVIYHLATNPKLAAKMALMTPVGQARQFGRLEARFDKTTPKPNNNKIPNTSTPAPRRKGGKGPRSFDVKSSSFADFERQIEAEESNRR